MLMLSVAIHLNCGNSKKIDSTATGCQLLLSIFASGISDGVQDQVGLLKNSPDLSTGHNLPGVGGEKSRGGWRLLPTKPHRMAKVTYWLAFLAQRYDNVANNACIEAQESTSTDGTLTFRPIDDKQYVSFFPFSDLICFDERCLCGES